MEALAAMWALDFASEIGIPTAVLEGDLETTINSLKDADDSLAIYEV